VKALGSSLSVLLPTSAGASQKQCTAAVGPNSARTRRQAPHGVVGVTVGV